ncbi:MAG: ABC transporter substrate-binding protein [Acetobacteraceae bacterium]
MAGLTARRVAAIAGLLLAAVLFAAGTAVAQDIKIGVVNPYSGPMALYGDEMTRGYDIAIEQANAKGGVLGRKITLVRASATSAQEAISAVEQLIGRDKVDLLSGTYVTAISNAASEASLNNGKLFWETNALSKDLTNRGLPNFARSGPDSVAFARRSVEGVLQLVIPKLGKQPRDVKVWIEHEDTSFGTSIGKEQERLLKEAGVQVSIGSHSARAIDLSDSVLRAKSAAPDIWLSTGYVIDHNLLLRTMREQSFAPAATMLVGTGDTPETLEALGKDALNGVLLVSYPRADIGESYGPGAGAFLAAYKAKYNRDPIAPQAMSAYVGMKILLAAIADAKSTEYEKVIAAAAKMDKPFGTYETGYGVKFDATMQNTRALPVIAQWQDGQVHAVFPNEALAPGSTLVAFARK